MIQLTLPYPPSANRYWRTRVITPNATGVPIVSTYVSADAKAFKEAVGWLARKGGVRAPIAGRIELAYLLHPRLPQDWRLRARKDPAGWEDTVMCMDLDNAQKVLIDALKGIAFDDDKWVRKITAQRGKPLAEACLKVWIARLVEDEPETPQAVLELT